MRNLTATLCLTVAVLVGSAGMSWCADYQKGYAAYESGDYSTAVREWTPLAEQGDATSQTFMGMMYGRGEGVPQDYKAAVKWYTLAAEQGSAFAQQNLGVMYAKGRGVPENHKTAVKWFRLAAEQGYASAQMKLSAAYLLGRGVIKDTIYGHMWANLAASNGDETGGKFRDLLAQKMTPSQLEKAQDLARECVRKKYKGC
jgi:TPR repeat protein